MEKLTGSQRKIIAACMLFYTTAYLNRLNLAAAFTGIIEALSITKAQAGLLQTAFAVAYAAGQMVNGALVDRVNPIRHMLLGLVGSGICNLFMGIIGAYAPFMCLCVLNGAFQSMLWTPILRLLALHFHTQESREKANIITSLTLVVGHMGAWAISGYLARAVGWKLSFITPALFVLPAAALGILIFRRVPAPRENAPRAQSAPTPAQKRTAKEYLRLFAASGFFVILFTSVLFGFVRDGIKTWSPTILNDFSGKSDLSSTSFSLIIPVINAAGMLLAYAVQRRGRMRNRWLVALLLAAGACMCLPLTGTRALLPAALLMGGGCACMAGLEPILTALVPLEYDRERLIGLSAGLIDSFVYLGSALAGVCAGLVYERLGVNALFLGWTLAALAASAGAWLSGALYKKYRTGENA